MPSPTPSVVTWRTTLVAVLTIGIVWLFARSLDVSLVWRHIRSAHPALLAGAVAATIATYLVRAWRWQVLLRPIGRARFASAFRVTVIGFTATFLLPGRPGEILRPLLIARTERFDVA